MQYLLGTDVYTDGALCWMLIGDRIMRFWKLIQLASWCLLIFCPNISNSFNKNTRIGQASFLYIWPINCWYDFNMSIIISMNSDVGCNRGTVISQFYDPQVYKIIHILIFVDENDFWWDFKWCRQEPDIGHNREWRRLSWNHKFENSVLLMVKFCVIQTLECLDYM